MLPPMTADLTEVRDGIRQSARSDDSSYCARLMVLKMKSSVKRDGELNKCPFLGSEKDSPDVRVWVLAVPLAGK